MLFASTLSSVDRFFAALAIGRGLKIELREESLKSRNDAKRCKTCIDKLNFVNYFPLFRVLRRRMEVNATE